MVLPRKAEESTVTTHGTVTAFLSVSAEMVDVVG